MTVDEDHVVEIVEELVDTVFLPCLADGGRLVHDVAQSDDEAGLRHLPLQVAEGLDDLAT